VNRQIINRRYRIERKIGEGATAEVFLGFDIVLNRRVAIKTLRTQHAANRGFRLRFEREAQNAASLSHPNIIAIFDVGEDSGLPYIVMEFIDGQTLKEIIESEGPFHPDDVAILIEQVAAGLDYAHGYGLIHRDVKPQNILVDRQGLAKVVDFGIAKGLSESSLQLTETGTALGTVHYISPEQASGLMATPESDIYSLGVVAYEMLTVQLPFEADSAIGIAMRHLNDTPQDPSSINPEVPPEVSDIVLQALHKNPSRRFPTAGAFARALSDWRLYEPAPRLAAKFAAPPAAPPSSTRVRADQLETLQSLRTDGSAAAQIPARSPRDKSAPASKGGGASWIAGLVAIAGIAAFLWYGFDLPGRFQADGSDAGPTATRAANSSLATVAPTRTSDDARPSIAPATGLSEVPNVLDQSQTAADQLLAEAGFVVEYGEDVSSITVPEGSIAAQVPAPGTSAEEGSTVTLQLSSGPELIDLANLEVAGRNAEEVYAELGDLGLNAVETLEGSQTVPEGAVIRIEPSDVARVNDVINVFVSQGDRVLIPIDIQGDQLESARSRLEEAGLVVKDQIPVSAQVILNAGLDMDSAGIVDGDVVGVQDNDAQFGGWIDRGASVTLVYYDATLDSQGEPTIGASS
jgi:eukaryotic-like serine/threonine-protein kinase